MILSATLRVTAVVPGLLAAPLGAKAQPAGKAPGVGVLGSGSAAEMFQVQGQPCERALHELDWAPAVNGVLEYQRCGGGDAAHLHAPALEPIGE